jgi:protein TonB
VVAVKFVKAAAPKPPAPPPPPAAKKPPSDRPKTEVKKAPPMAMVQPKTVEDEIKPADPNEVEEEYDYGDGDGTGVIGGVVGGQAPTARTVEEAPRYLATGFKPPRLADKSCLADRMHLSSAIAERVQPGPITCKFAVYSNGAVGSFQVLTPVDHQVAEFIKRAVTSCEWVPGADQQGRPTALWVIQPFRFQD